MISTLVLTGTGAKGADFCQNTEDLERVKKVQSQCFAADFFTKCRGWYVANVVTGETEPDSEYQLNIRRKDTVFNQVSLDEYFSKHIKHVKPFVYYTSTPEADEIYDAFFTPGPHNYPDGHDSFKPKYPDQTLYTVLYLAEWDSGPIEKSECPLYFWENSSSDNILTAEWKNNKGETTCHYTDGWGSQHGKGVDLRFTGYNIQCVRRTK